MIDSLTARLIYIAVPGEVIRTIKQPEAFYSCDEECLVLISFLLSSLIWIESGFDC